MYNIYIQLKQQHTGDTMSEMNEAYLHLVETLEELKTELDELKKSSEKDEENG